MLIQPYLLLVLLVVPGSALLSKVIMIVLVPRIIKSEAEILNSSSEPENDTFSVLCSSEKALKRTFKLLPWESKGKLKFDGSIIEYEGIRRNGGRVRYQFPRDGVKISYLPPRLLRDGGLTWLKIESPHSKFLFSSIIHENIEMPEAESTTGIYRLVSNVES